MAVSRGAVLFLFLLLVAAEMGTSDAKMGVAKQKMISDKVKEEENKEKEGNQCLSKSLQFKGFCFNSDQCAQVCLSENFPGGGECKHEMAVRKCFCKKPC